ncbi:MAG: Holliday junction branch migration protein RuvA [Syntrophomonadaceae bacterium]|nr:Holliday junction branch migration protein RuvA [Syntrophomonadaceae bacterium]
MISFLRGILVDVTTDTVLVDVNGVGFEAVIHARGLQTMPGQGQEVTIFTRLQVSDNELKLYGFLSRTEMELFNRITSISGIGPRVAMSILGYFEPTEFFRAIAAQDRKALTTVPGVGKKNAERLIFELKDRIPISSVPVGSEGSEADALLEALLGLGYSRDEVYPHIVAILEQNEEKVSLEENLRRVLKVQGQSRRKR